MIKYNTVAFDLFVFVISLSFASMALFVLPTRLPHGSRAPTDIHRLSARRGKNIAHEILPILIVYFTR